MGKTLKIFTLYLILPMVTLNLSGCRTEKPFEPIIEDIRLIRVPDPREGVFEVHCDRTGRNEITLYGEVDDSRVKAMLEDSLTSAGFIVSNRISVLPVDVPWQWALVDISIANIRSSPSHRSELVNQAVMGTPVKVLRERGSWVYIQTPDRYLGWCEKASLAGLSEITLSEWKSSDRSIYINISGYVYDTEGERTISDIVAGSIIEKTGSKGNLTMVRLPGGREGAVVSDDIADFDLWKRNKSPYPAELIKTAFAMKGFPYLWGGTSVKAFDCSGFTRTVFFLNGLIIPRDASLQARHGQPIDISGGSGGPEPGDLLFFRASPDGPDNSPVIHVGIYTGNSQFIHAAGRVMVNSLDSTLEGFDAFRASTLQSARRIHTVADDDWLVPVNQHPWY